MKKIILLCMICLMTLSALSQQAEYVDLGLPSGTLWKSKNEKGKYYTYEKAMRKFGTQMPTREQFAELKAYCTWIWNGSGYTVKGNNGNYIVLPALGRRGDNGDLKYVGTDGYYLSADPCGVYYSWIFCFSSIDMDISNYGIYGRLSVRLVMNTR